MRVTIEIDLNDEFITTFAEAEDTVTGTIADRIDDSESIVAWDITKIERTDA